MGLWTWEREPSLGNNLGSMQSSNRGGIKWPQNFLPRWHDDISISWWQLTRTRVNQLAPNGVRACPFLDALTPSIQPLLCGQSQEQKQMWTDERGNGGSKATRGKLPEIIINTEEIHTICFLGKKSRSCKADSLGVESRFCNLLLVWPRTMGFYPISQCPQLEN